MRSRGVRNVSQAGISASRKSKSGLIRKLNILSASHSMLDEVISTRKVCRVIERVDVQLGFRGTYGRLKFRQ